MLCSCKELREIELESAVALLEHELAEKENAICKLTSQIKEARSNAAADAFLILQLLGVKGGKDTKANVTQNTAQSPSHSDSADGLTCHTAQHMGDVRIPLKARYKHTKNTDTQIASQSPSHSDSADGLTLKHNERIGDVKPRYTVHHWRPTYRFAGDQEAGLTVLSTESAVSSDLLQSNIIAGKRKRTVAQSDHAYCEDELDSLLSLSSVSSSESCSAFDPQSPSDCDSTHTLISSCSGFDSELVSISADPRNIYHSRHADRSAVDEKEAKIPKCTVSSDVLQSNIVAGKRKRTAAHTKDIRHYAYSKDEVNSLLSLSSICSSYLSAYNS